MIKLFLLSFANGLTFYISFSIESSLSLVIKTNKRFLTVVVVAAVVFVVVAVVDDGLVKKIDFFSTNETLVRKYFFLGRHWNEIGHFL